MRKALVALILLLFAGLAGAQKVQKASEILKAAQNKATTENKSIFLIFGASWCDACHEFDSFLALPEVAPVIERYFVVAKVTFGEGVYGHRDWDTPGSDLLLEKYGGVSATGRVGIPFIALLDTKAKLIASSAPKSNGGRSGGETSGFPTEPEEVKLFLSLLEKAAPALTADDLHTIETGLHHAAAD